MSFAISNLAAQTRAAQSQSRLKRRWIHNALRKQAIMMPALSPFATDGIITRWMVKEGDTFQPGDVLLQVENDTGICDVEACSPGIMGKILTPDGTVPVEAVIAIVARDATELAAIQSQSVAPTPPPFISTPAPPSTSIPSSASLSSATPTGSSSGTPRHTDFKMTSRMTLSPRTPRTPSLFEMHTMGHGQRSVASVRSAHVGGPSLKASLRLDLSVPCPSPRFSEGAKTAGWESARTPLTASYTHPAPRSSAADNTQIDGAVLRRMIVANLAAASKTGSEIPRSCREWDAAKA